MKNLRTLNPKHPPGFLGKTRGRGFRVTNPDPSSVTQSLRGRPVNIKIYVHLFFVFAHQMTKNHSAG